MLQESSHEWHGTLSKYGLARSRTAADRADDGEGDGNSDDRRNATIAQWSNFNSHSARKDEGESDLRGLDRPAVAGIIVFIDIDESVCFFMRGLRRQQPM